MDESGGGVVLADVKRSVQAMMIVVVVEQWSFVVYMGLEIWWREGTNRTIE